MERTNGQIKKPPRTANNWNWWRQQKARGKKFSSRGEIILKFWEIIPWDLWRENYAYYCFCIVEKSFVTNDIWEWLFPLWKAFLLFLSDNMKIIVPATQIKYKLPIFFMHRLTCLKILTKHGWKWMWKYWTCLEIYSMDPTQMFDHNLCNSI